MWGFFLKVEVRDADLIFLYHRGLKAAPPIYAVF